PSTPTKKSKRRRKPSAPPCWRSWPSSRSCSKIPWWTAAAGRSWNDEAAECEKAGAAEPALFPAGPVCHQPGGSLAAGDRGGRFCQVALVLLHPAGGAGELVAQPAPTGFAGGALLRRWLAAGGVSERQERQEVPPQRGVWFGPLGQP